MIVLPLREWHALALRSASQAGGVPAGWREALELSLEAVALALEIAVRRGVTADWLPTQALFLKTHERIVNALSASPPPPATDGDALREALEALEPFARHASAYHSFDGQHDFLDKDEITLGAFKCTVGDLRRADRARTALASVPTPVSGTDAVEVEREVCAKIADSMAPTSFRSSDDYQAGQANACEAIAAAIRSRGTDGGAK